MLATIIHRRTIALALAHFANANVSRAHEIAGGLVERRSAGLRRAEALCCGTKSEVVVRPAGPGCCGRRWARPARILPCVSRIHQLAGIGSAIRRGPRRRRRLTPKRRWRRPKRSVTTRCWPRAGGRRHIPAPSRAAGCGRTRRADVRPHPDARRNQCAVDDRGSSLTA